MDDWSERLRGIGIRRALLSLLDDLEAIDPDSLLFSVVKEAVQNGAISAACFKLMMLDLACEELVRRGSPKEEVQKALNSGSAKLAEVIAGGILGAVFPEIERIPEKRKAKTPDFRLGDNVFVEVYCPQQSTGEDEKYSAWLRRDDGPVKTFLGRPITGSTANALRYPSNVVIDRAVNGKREKNQFELGSENLLWVDFLNGFGISSQDTRPYISVHVGENTFVGSFGVWHSMYGKRGSLLLSERTDLRFLREQNFYEQRQEGYFRLRPEVSGALMLVSDGIVLFENPWAHTPLSTLSKQRLKRLVRFKPDMSWLAVPEHNLEDRVNSALGEIVWLSANAEG